MKNGHHLIQRQTVELALASREGAQALQEEVRRVVLGKAMRAVDEVLSGLAHDDEVVLLGRIEIDMGVIAPAHFEEEFVERTRIRLREALAKAIPLLRDASPGAREGVLGLPASKVDALAHFLRTGQLPWWTTDSSRVDPERLLLDVLDELPQALSALLRDQGSERIGRRVVRQFSPGVQERILALLVPHDGVAIRDLVTEWVQVIEGIADISAVIGNAGSFVRESAITYLIASPATSATGLSNGIISSLASALGAEPVQLCTRLAARVEGVLSEESSVRRWIEAAGAGEVRRGKRAPSGAAGSSGELSGSPPGFENPEDQFETDVEEYTSARETLTDQRGEPRLAQGKDGDVLFPERRSTTEPARNPENPWGKLPAQTWPESEIASREIPEAEVVYLDNAGLVILWPFLLRFFEAIGLLRDKRFVAATAQERTVLLLQHLATGCAEAPEHLLTLNKLLCGLPVFEGVGRAVELTDLEMRESVELLSSVIALWRALQGTTVDGLRAAFLRRAGRLARQNNGWQLNVQRVGYDVLLDSLPWALGVVALPWMKEPLFVEW